MKSIVFGWLYCVWSACRVLFYLVLQIRSRGTQKTYPQTSSTSSNEPAFFRRALCVLLLRVNLLTLIFGNSNVHAKERGGCSIACVHFGNRVHDPCYSWMQMIMQVEPEATARSIFNRAFSMFVVRRERGNMKTCKRKCKHSFEVLVQCKNSFSIALICFYRHPFHLPENVCCLIWAVFVLQLLHHARVSVNGVYTCSFWFVIQFAGQ